MKVSRFFISFIIVVVILVAILVIWDWNRSHPAAYVPPASSVVTSATETGAVSGQVSTTAPVFDQSIADGTITIAYPSSEFALATTPAQILSQSVIPPCDSNFNYCLYYNGTAYQETNFESAGLHIEKRADLVTETSCLNTRPTGYTNLSPVIVPASATSQVSAPDYATSLFTPVGGGAAGSYATGSLYRLWYKGAPGTAAACYEFETRIGQSQFANYPPGSIQQFSAADQATVQTTLNAIVADVILPSGEKAQFPND